MSCEMCNAKGTEVATFISKDNYVIEMDLCGSCSDKADNPKEGFYSEAEEFEAKVEEMCYRIFGGGL